VYEAGWDVGGGKLADDEAHGGIGSEVDLEGQREDFRGVGGPGGHGDALREAAEDFSGQ
jgi:hypothetical protein